MSSGIRMIIVLLSTLFLLQGCSDRGGGSSSETPSVGDEPTINEVSIRNGLFSIEFKDANTNVFDYELSIKRDGVELTDTLLEYISHEKKSDGSIVITLKEVVTNGQSEGLTTLKLGDVITLEAKGYTPQQFVVDENMLRNASVEIALKAVESRQTYNLADLIAGADSVVPKSARGARTVYTDEGVVLETLNSGVSLIFPTITYERLVRKVSRLPRSNPNTQVYIDMTSIDPRTEHSATIGDFSYDATAEPSYGRTANATDDAQTALESVVMADIRMTTDNGDEIHCFDGEYDATTNTCSGTAMATLKMQIPESQFNHYAQKYNDGDRLVPLYSYNKVKATWVRQVDSDGKGIDAELVLTDNDGNQKANEGDILTLVGQVGHFSWWNGDYPIQRTCLNVKVDLSQAPEAAAYVQVRGVDYTGRIFTKYLNADTTEVQGIFAKENAIVSIELIMDDGSVGDSINYATGFYTGTCEDVNGTLIAPKMNKHTLDIVVKDTNGNPLEGATVRTKGQYRYTDSDGKTEVSYSYRTDSNLSETIYVSYDTGNFSTTVKKEVTQDTSSPVTFELDIEENRYTGRVVEEINGQSFAAAGAYVQIYNSDPFYSKTVKTDENGNFEILLPKSKIEQDSEVTIYIYKYNSDYAFYTQFIKEMTLSSESSYLGEFKLAFDTHIVTGQVIDMEGKAIANATVFTSGSSYRSTTSDENGNFKLTLIGESGLDVSIQAYTYKEKYLYSDKKFFTTAQNGKTNIVLSIDLRKAVIKGRVLTSEGIALENKRVYWSNDYYHNVLTDEKGYFSLETYNGGDGFIRVYDPANNKYLDFDKNIDIRDVALNGVEIGKIYDLGNLLAVEENFAPIISKISIDPNTPLVDVPFNIIVDAYDPDSDEINYGVEEYYGTNAASISVNGNIATINISSSGYYYFYVKVTDVNGNTTQKLVSVYVKNHALPVIDSVAVNYPNSKSYFDKSTPLVIKTEAYSPEGNSLSYSYKLISLNAKTPDGVVDVNESDPSYASIPTDIANGKYRLVVTVSDVYNETSTRRYITIDDTVAPEIDILKLNDAAQTSITIKEGDTVSFDVNLTSTKVSSPSWYWYINGQTFTAQSIDPMSFSEQGSYYGYVTVTDSVGRSDSRTFYIHVQENAKPVIDEVTVTPAILTKIGDNYKDSSNNEVADLTIRVLAHDDDSSSLTYSFGKLGEVEANVSDNNATYILNNLSVGRHSIKITVSDGTNSVDRYINIEVLQDSPPVITELRVPLSAKAGTTATLFANATDPNGQALTYKWSVTSGTILDSGNQSASIILPQTVQDINITLTVSDGTNEVARERTLKVLANIAPVIEYFSLRTISVTLDDPTLELKSIFGDLDGSIEDARYVLLDENGTIVDELSITQSNVVALWKPEILTTGNYEVYLVVTDDDNKTTKSNKANLIVEEKNSAPVITALTITSSSLLVNEIATLNIAATDPDGDPLNITWSANGGSIVVDATAQDKATFSASSPGVYTITAIVTDTNGAKAIKTVEVNVNSATLTISSSTTLYTIGDDVTLTASMSSGDITPSATSWSIISKPDNSTLTFTSTGASVTFTPDVVGTYRVKADTVIHGVEYTAEFSFSVKDENATPDIEGVVKADNGDILSGAIVRLYNKTDVSLYDKTVYTDSEGYYSFSDVAPGIYYLVVYAGNGYVSHTEVIEIK